MGKMPRRHAAGLFWLLVVASTVATRAPKHMPKFVFSRSESPITIPLSVNVVLVGFGDHARPSSFRLDAQAFQDYLGEVMPEHHPSLVEVGEKMHVQYEVWYDVAHASHELEHSLSDTIKGAMRKSDLEQPSSSITGNYKSEGGGGMIPVFDIHVEGRVEEALDTTFSKALASSYLGTGQDEHHQQSQERAYGLLILNLDKNRIAPTDLDHHNSPDKSKAYAYRYVYGSGRATSGSDTFVTKGRYAVADLSSGPSQFGNSQAGEGAVMALSLPRAYADEWQKPGQEMKFRARLGNLVISAVKYVFAPDVQFDALDFSERVLVPIIVFRNHILFDPLAQGSSFSIDLDRIKTEVARMAMPGQTIEIVTGLQSLIEHERIAIALSHSVRSDTTHESVNGRYRVQTNDFLDSLALFQSLRDGTSDYLTSGLISASPVMSHTYFPDFKKGEGGKWATGTRVLPVYVFSIMDQVHPLVFDTKLPYAVSKEAVLVVQTGDDVKLPYFTGQKQLTATYRDTTGSIIAGVGAALGGLMPPHRRYSQQHSRLMSDFTWSHGYFPWGPFSNSTGFSQVSIDSILMNSVVSRLDASVERVTDALLRMDDFADEYLYDPLGASISEGRPLGVLERLQKRGSGDSGPLLVSYETLRELHDDLLKVEAMMSNHVETLYMQKPEQVHRLSDEIFQSASGFHAHTLQILKHARDRVECCSVKHALEKRTSWHLVSRAVLMGVIVSCLLALLAFLNPQGKKGGRLRPSLDKKSF